MAFLAELVCTGGCLFRNFGNLACWHRNLLLDAAGAALDKGDRMMKILIIFGLVAAAFDIIWISKVMKYL